MIHAFHFENGKISYRNRWVQTSKWKQERTAGRALVNSLNPMEPDPIFNFEGEDGTANTNIIFHANKLLALEEGHPPFELDPMTLESKGSWDYQGKLHSAMTAHPKIDPETGELHGFGYMTDHFGSKTMTYHVIDRNGQMLRSDVFEAPYAAMVHDFMSTRDYVIFPLFPLTCDLDRVAKFGFPFAFDRSAGAYIGG